MYCVMIMYPRAEGGQFDLKHYLDVHMPMGVGLLFKHTGVKPVKVVIQTENHGMDGSAGSSAYNTLCSVYFNTEQEANQFITVFNIEEAARLLKADWPKYTNTNPIAEIGRAFELDVDELICKSDKVIATAKAELQAAE